MKSFIKNDLDTFGKSTPFHPPHTYFLSLTENCVHPTDAAFLLYIFVYLHCGVEMPNAWYAKSTNLAAIMQIQKWMEKEAKSTPASLVGNGNKALKKHVHELSALLSAHTVDLEEEEDEDNDDLDFWNGKLMYNVCIIIL